VKRLSKQLASVVGEANVWDTVGVVAEKILGDVVEDVSMW
jgi:hypothetical protein